MVLSEFYLGIEIFWGGSRRVGGGAIIDNTVGEDRYWIQMDHSCIRDHLKNFFI